MHKTRLTLSMHIPIHPDGAGGIKRFVVYLDDRSTSYI